MKKFLAVCFLFFFCSGACFAVIKINNDFFRRGCCSHHGGVCGCSHGRAVCCDGSLSPSCGCD
ncbi:MAG: hypothetical protein KHX03_00355 [Clostridium sp.]|nr:hypothetical protein [Clostridium sp.]